MVSMRSVFAYLWSYPERVVYFLVCCVLVFLLALKKNKPEFKSIRNLLVIPSLVLIVMFLNPVSTHFLVPNVMEHSALLLDCSCRIDYGIGHGGTCYNSQKQGR